MTRVLKVGLGVCEKDNRGYSGEEIETSGNNIRGAWFRVC